MEYGIENENKNTVDKYIILCEILKTSFIFELNNRKYIFLLEDPRFNL